MTPKNYFYDQGMTDFGPMLPKSILNDRTLLSELYLSRICHLNQFSSILSKIFYAFWALGTIFDPKKLFLRPGNDWFWCNMQKSTSNNQTLLSELHWRWIYHLNQFSSILSKICYAFWSQKAIRAKKNHFHSLEMTDFGQILTKSISDGRTLLIKLL